MSKDILNDLQINPCLTKAGGKGVPEDMAAKARKKDRVFIKVGLQQDLIVAISGNPLDGLIKCALVLHITVTVHENKIIVSINSCLAFDTVFFLISALHLKCFLYTLDHRNLTLTGVSLGCIDAVIGSHLVTVVVVDQSVVHADKATLEVYVSPSEAGDLANSHPGVEHDIENRIPMLIGVSLADKLQEKRYKEQIPYLFEADYCAGITLWGYIYGATWTTDGNSGIIKNGADRPAMEWLRKYMASDDAKNAKSPFPGMKKEASVYVKPSCIKVTQNDVVPIDIRASLRTKTIDHIDFYIDNKLYKTFTADEPYRVEFTPTEKKKYNLKAIVVATDGTAFERLSSVTAYEPRGTYKDQIAELPGTLQAENFDTGADGIAYHDSNSNKEGDAASYRSDGGIDIVKGNGGYALGYTNNGEWMEYTVDVKEAGVYEYDAVVSSGTTNSGFSISLINNGKTTNLTPSLVVPQTGNNDWGKYVSLHGRLSVPLEAGKQVIRINITGSSCNIDKIVFNRIDVDKNIKVTATSEPSPATINENATIKVDASSPNSDIKEVRIYLDNVLKTTIKASPFEYTYKPTQKGTFNFTVEAIDAQDKCSDLVSFTLKVNNKRTAYKGVIAIPGVIEAENFDKGGEGFTFHDADSNDEGGVNYRSDNEGVDIVRGGSGYALGYTSSNDEWLEYSIDVKEAGEYEYIATASSGSNNSGFTLSLVNDGKTTQLCKVNVPNTGDWSTYKTITGKLSRKLEAGPQIIRLQISGPYCNIDKIELKCTASGISDVIMDYSSDGVLYNLSGQKVDANYRGIIIQNGKKRLNK